MWDVVLIIAGLGVLIAGGELLVRGSSALAVALRINPLVVGLTVVAFGTSAPELAVSIQSSLAGKADLAIGNVVGSNIANVLLILGLAASITPLTVSSRLVRFDVPLMIGVSILMMVLALDGNISRLDGCLLFAGLIAYTVWTVVQSRRESQRVQREFAAELPTPHKLTHRHLLLQLALVAVGLLLLCMGASWLIAGAVRIAQALGVSQLVIGLTIIAIGTSLPEIVATIVAALRGERDLAVGNVIGSNLFNILSVLGLTSIVAPHGVEVSRAALRLDLPIMIAVAFACFPIFYNGHRIARWEGLMFLAYYVCYTTYLVMAAVASGLTRTFATVMIWYVIPLTMVTLAIGVVRTWRNSRSISS
jgi:cation:H+ antiporter